jgi:hypothetical protein
MVSEKDVMKPKTPPKIKYHEASRGSIIESIKSSIPKEMIPTTKTGYVLGMIFLLVILYGIATFPFGKMMSGSVEGLEIKIGLPWPFLVFDLMNPATAPIRIGGLIWDIVVYIILSYAVDIAINLFLNSPIFESEEEKKKRPQVFRDINGKKIKNIIAETYVKEINENKDKSEEETDSSKTEEIKTKKNNSRTTFVKEDGWFKKKDL